MDREEPLKGAERSRDEPGRRPRPEEMVGTLEHELAKFLSGRPEQDPPGSALGDFIMNVDREALGSNAGGESEE